MTVHRSASRTFRTVLLGVLAGLLATAARADLVEVGSGTGGGIPYTKCGVNSFKDGIVSFTTSQGIDVAKPLASFKRIVIDGEPAFNAAEDAYQARNWDKATENYDKAVRTSQKDVVRAIAAVRLQETAGKGGRFDVAIKNFIEMARRSPADAKSAVLNMPAADSTYLTDAIKSLNEALNDPKVKDASKEPILKALSDCYAARKDTKNKEDADAKLAQVKMALNPNSAEARAAGMMVRLNKIREMLAKGEYDKTIAAVEADAAEFVDPAQQADALFMVAEAMAGKAGDSKDPKVWKDVAVAYMRVSANCPNTAPQVPAALLKAASILANQLNSKPEAIQLYKQIQNEYKDQAPAKEAAKELEKLG